MNLSSEVSKELLDFLESVAKDRPVMAYPAYKGRSLIESDFTFLNKNFSSVVEFKLELVKQMGRIAADSKRFIKEDRNLLRWIHDNIGSGDIKTIHTNCVALYQYAVTNEWHL